MELRNQHTCFCTISFFTKSIYVVFELIIVGKIYLRLSQWFWLIDTANKSCDELWRYKLEADALLLSKTQPRKKLGVDFVVKKYITLWQPTEHIHGNPSNIIFLRSGCSMVLRKSKVTNNVKTHTLSFAHSVILWPQKLTHHVIFWGHMKCWPILTILGQRNWHFLSASGPRNS